MINLHNSPPPITGTLIWYYYICQREVWLMAHQLQAHQDNQFLELGRFFHEQSYQKEKKSIRLENIELDLIKRKDGEYVVGEIKKSSRFEKSATMQLAFYLLRLREYGVEAKGELLFPKEKKRITVELTEDMTTELEKAKQEIQNICLKPKPPVEEWISFCKNCAYCEFCWS